MNPLPQTIVPEAPQRPLSTASLNTPASPKGRSYKRILVGTDFSTASIPAFEQALELAKLNQAELLIAHSSVIPNALGFMPSGCYDNWEIRRRAKAQDNISALIQKARQEGVRAHMLELSGYADDALVKTAKRLGVDLIVVGTHGRRGVTKFFSESIAQQIVARAPCGVLTVHSPCQGK